MGAFTLSDSDLMSEGSRRSPATSQVLASSIPMESNGVVHMSRCDFVYLPRLIEFLFICETTFFKNINFSLKFSLKSRSPFHPDEYGIKFFTKSLIFKIFQKFVEI